MTTNPERTDRSLVEGFVFRVLHAANLVARPFPKAIGRKHHLTLASWRAMMVLAAEPGLSGDDIARRTGLDRMSASRAVRLLESAGRACRVTSARDQKRFEWRLTADGWALHDVISVLAMRRERDIMAGLDAEMLRNADTVLKQIAERLQSEG
jgi:DNA-binding MarR family transcriptional regulator